MERKMGNGVTKNAERSGRCQKWKIGGNKDHDIGDIKVKAKMWILDSTGSTQINWV